MRSRIYSLRTVNDRTVLSLDLTGLIVSETHQTLQIKLETGTIYLNKWDYLNKMRVYDDGKVFFIIATKAVCQKYIKKFLLEYSIIKIDSRLDNLLNFKERLEKELVAA